MTRRISNLAAGLLALLLALNFAGQALAAPVQYFYNFQKSVYPWTVAYRCDPVPTGACNASAALQLRMDRKYGSYAALYNKGANLFWMRNDFFASSNSVSVQFDTLPVENAGRLTPVIYVGYAEPNGVGTFQKIGLPLQNGWQHLTYKLAAPILPPAPVAAGSTATRPQIQMVVAIGFMNLGGAKDVQVGGIDNVQITFYDK
jgi:hypothetical protein